MRALNPQFSAQQHERWDSVGVGPHETVLFEFASQRLRRLQIQTHHEPARAPMATVRSDHTAVPWRIKQAQTIDPGHQSSLRRSARVALDTSC
jgi:hypothetical protein